MWMKMSSVPSPHAIEPFHHDDLEAAARRNLDMCACRELGRVHGRGFVHGDDAENLKALRADGGFAHHARTFVGGLKPISAQRRHMKQDIRTAAIRQDETVAL